MSLGTRLMNAVVNVLTAILNIRIRFKYVLLAFIIFVGGAIGITYKHMLDLVGGKDDFDEAKRMNTRHISSIPRMNTRVSACL